jgi:hypothetical protein
MMFVESTWHAASIATSMEKSALWGPKRLTEARSTPGPTA